VRTRLAAVALAVLAGAGVTAFAAAQSTANGLPSYTDGYLQWRKLNRTPITAPGAHNGIKNVYASKRKVGTRYPNGTVIVKSIRERGTTYIGQVAVMRKVSGRWQMVEYERSTPRGRFRAFAQGQLCLSCHVQVKARDYVFTRG
jgi:hypothetical protein